MRAAREKSVGNIGRGRYIESVIIRSIRVWVDGGIFSAEGCFCFCLSA